MIRLAKLFFYAAVFFFPFRVDSFLWSVELFQSGFFNPFAAHFVYLSDVFLLLGGGAFATNLMFGGEYLKKLKGWALVAVGAFYLWAILSLFWSVDLVNSGFYLGRLLMLGGVYWLVAGKFLDWRVMLKCLLAALVVQAGIGIAQFWLQSSVGLGALGESLVNVKDLGVAKFSFLDRDWLRAYGTFVHPNVFAGYLVVGLLGLLVLDLRKWLKWTVFFLLFVALMLTFSRGAMLAFVLVLPWVMEGNGRKWYWLLLALVVGVFVLRFAEMAGDRGQFLLAAREMIKNDVLGVGLGNFTLVMQDFVSFELLPWSFQPVHNVFLLVAAELGLMGLVLFLWFCGLKLLKKETPNFLRAMLLALLIVGLFDHYPVTLYQGQALFWIVLSLNSRW